MILQEQSAVSCSGSRGKRLRTLSEEDQNVDYGTSPVTVPEIHDKDDEEEDEESRKKVYSTLILCFSFCNPLHLIIRIIFSLLLSIHFKVLTRRMFLTIESFFSW